jgi:hypothetical protein
LQYSIYILLTINMQLFQKWLAAMLSYGKIFIIINMKANK